MVEGGGGGIPGEKQVIGEEEESLSFPNLRPSQIARNGKYHNTLCLSPQILNKYCFCSLLGPL